MSMPVNDMLSHFQVSCVLDNKGALDQLLGWDKAKVNLTSNLHA